MCDFGNWMLNLNVKASKNSFFGFLSKSRAVCALFPACFAAFVAQNADRLPHTGSGQALLVRRSRAAHSTPGDKIDTVRRAILGGQAV